MNSIHTVPSQFDTYIKLMVFVAPALCSMLCALLIMFSMQNHRTSVSRQTRIIAVLSLGAVGILWIYPGISLGLNQTDSNAVWIVLCALLVMSVEITLTYLTLRSLAERNAPEDKNNRRPELTRKAVEDYFRTAQPHINSEFKLEELAEAMGVNRSEMSGFINRTFGMNFKRYVNRWRLNEYERLMSLPSNDRKNPYKVMPMAGFTDPRHYNRALAVEQSNGKHND